MFMDCSWVKWWPRILVFLQLHRWSVLDPECWPPLATAKDNFRWTYDLWSVRWWFCLLAMEKNWRSTNGVITPVMYVHDCDADSWSEQCRNRMDRKNWVKSSVGENGGAGSDGSQSSRLMLLILMWSHANLTMILRDILSEGSDTECIRISVLTMQKCKVKAGGFFFGNYNSNILCRSKLN